MSKLIIHINDSDISHAVALDLVADVVKQGLVRKTANGKQYCFVTAFMKRTYIVYTRKSKRETYKFYINKGEEQ